MADPRLQQKGIISSDIPQPEFSSSQISGLEKIAISSANEAAKFQQTSEKLYMADFEKNARQAISEISERNKSDPEQLKKDLVESYKGFSQNAPFQLKGVMEAQYEIMGRPMINNALNLRNKINNDKLKEASLSNMTEAFKNLEMSSVGMLSPDANVAYDASRSAQLQMNTIMNTVNEVGEDGAPLFPAATRIDTIEKAKQAVVSAGIRGDFDASTNKLQAYQDFIEGKKKFKFYDEDGNVVEELDPLFEMNRGTFEKTRNYMESEVKSILKAERNAIDIASFQQKLDDGSLLIDPKNKTDRKSVDTYFDEVLGPQLEGSPDAIRNEEIVKLVNRVGILPSSVKGILRATLRNGSSENQMMSADLISKLQESKPQSLSELDGTDVSYGLLLTKNLRGGLTPDEAVSLTKEQFNPLKEDLRKLRRQDFKELGIDSEKDLKDEFAKRGWATLFINQTNLSQSKDISDQARIDYLNEYENQYVLTGDQKTAKDRASTIIGRNYGVTEITGSPRVTKYPPENYYAVEGLDNDWMSKQLVEDIKKETGRDITKFDIALVPDTETAREVSAKVEPAYSVMIRNDKGEYDPVERNNRILRFKFDSSQAVDVHNEAVKADQEQMLLKEDINFKNFKQREIDRFNRLKSGALLVGEKL